MKTFYLLISSIISIGFVFGSFANNGTQAWANGLDPLDIWHVRNAPVSNQLFAVTYEKNIFVAVGHNGTILTSPNGTIWTNRSVSGISNLESVAYGNNMFIAVGWDGTILTSTDGIIWTRRVSGTSMHLNDVIFEGNTFVVLGNLGTILTSQDGLTWTARVSGTDKGLFKVTYGKGVFVVTGGSAFTSTRLILTSSDAITWTQRISGNGEFFSGVAYGNSIFVAVNIGGTVFTSPDGITWTERTSIPCSFRIEEIVYIHSTFIATGSNGEIFTSPDGITWTSRDSGVSESLEGVTYGNNSVVIVGFGYIYDDPGNPFGGGTGTNIILQSDPLASPATPLDNWHVRNAPVSNQLFAVTYEKNIFVAVGHNGTILTSPNGTIWTNRSVSGISNLISVAYGNNVFIAVGWDGTILTSPGGVTWTRRISGTSVWLKDIIFAGNTFVVVGNSGTILTSQDGITWTAKFSGTTKTLFSVTYGKGVFVVTGGGSDSLGGTYTKLVLTSSDAITWTQRLSGNGKIPTFVAYGNSTFVGIDSDGTVFTSSDGITWIIMDSSIPFDIGIIKEMLYVPSAFIAIGCPSDIFTSPDGITWTSSDSGVPGTLSGVTYGNNSVVIVGLGYIYDDPGNPFGGGTGTNIILQSDPLASPGSSVGCSASNLNGCITEYECEAVGGYWYDGLCYTDLCGMTEGADSPPQVVVGDTPNSIIIQRGMPVDVPILFVGGTCTNKEVELYVFRADTEGNIVCFGPDGWEDYYATTLEDFKPLGNVCMPECIYLRWRAIENSQSLLDSTLCVCVDDKIDGIPTVGFIHCGCQAIIIE